MKNAQRSGGRAARDADCKGCTFSKAAAGADGAAHGLDQVFDDGQPQAGPAQLAGTGLVHAVEALENTGQVVFGNADAGVFDLQTYLGFFGVPANADTASGRGVFYGVV